MAATAIAIGTPIAIDLIGKLLGKLFHVKAQAAQTELPTPGTGDVKAQGILSWIGPILQSLVASGKLSAALPDGSALRTILDAVVASMKVSGVLPPSTSASSSIGDLIGKLVHQFIGDAEASLPISGLGPVKQEEVFAKVITALTNLATAGKIDKTLPADGTIRAIIDAVLESMKLSNVIPGSTLVPVTPTTTLIIPPGTCFTAKVT
jgi:uncharacterized ubiquitin-like protein YukD